MDREMLTVWAEESEAASRGLAGTYLRFCAANVGELKRLIARQDLPSVILAADRLKENAGLVGLSELSSLGRQLEEYCVGADWGAIDSACDAIVDTIRKLCAARPVRIRVEHERDEPADEVEVTRTA